MNSTLQRLELERNDLGEAGGQAIGKGLKVNLALERLLLSGNNLGSRAGQAIGEALKVNSTLTHSRSLVVVLAFLLISTLVDSEKKSKTTVCTHM